MTVQVRIANLPPLPDGETADLWFAVTETGLTTNVLRGENARRRLRHAAVARRLERVETLPAVMPETYDTAISVALAPTWNRDRLRARRVPPRGCQPQCARGRASLARSLTRLACAWDAAHPRESSAAALNPRPASGRIALCACP